ncbi:hypothetical protein GX411_11420 [Candidatus Fermentibacteria bacterium]|nr:hypothetical protein [Candidatus Fermentibacteria bacterium]
MFPPFSKAVPIAAPLTLAITGSALAFGFYDALDGGTPLPSIGAFSASTGGVRSTYAADALSIFLNPAGLARRDRPSLTASGGVLAWKEAFRYGTQRASRSGTIQGSNCFAVAYPAGEWLVVGAGAAAVARAEYDGSRYLEQPGLEGEPESIEMISTGGSQWEALGSVAASPTGWLDVGVSSGLRFGTLETEYSSTDEEGAIDSTSLITIEISELALRAGAQARADLFLLGVCYCPGGDHYRSSLACGMEVVAPQLANTIVGIEGEVYSPLADNDFTGRLHINHPIGTKTALRVGLSFSEYPEVSGRGMGFSLGGSRVFGPARADLAVQWATRSADGDFVPGEIADRIDDSTAEFLLGVTLVL